MSRFSFTMGTCFLAKLMSSCKLWFNTSACHSLSWARSSFSLSRLSCHLSSAISRIQASCSGKKAKKAKNEKVLMTSLKDNSVPKLHETQIRLWGDDNTPLSQWPFWTAKACSCSLHSEMLSTLFSKNLFLFFSLWRASTAYCLSASSRSIRYTTSPRTSFIFFNSGDNGHLSRGRKT